MRIFAAVFFALWITNTCLSQDTIHFVSKEVQAVKVEEVGINEIKYHRFDNLQGPSYVVNKKDILKIKYSNGHVDSFSVAAPKVVATEEKPVQVYNATPDETRSKIYVRGSRLYLSGRGVGETRLLKLITNYPDQQKKNVMLREYATMKGYKRNQYLSGFVGLGVGILAPIIGASAAVSNGNYQTFAAGLGAGVVIGVTGAVISGINKHKRTQKMIEIANIYNN